MKASLVLLLVLLLTAVSISNDKSIDTEVDEDQYLLHAESSERLLNIMQQISSVANTHNNEEGIEFTEEDMLDLIESVEELLFYAELMSIKVPATELEESKIVIFSAMASKLYDESLNIQQLAKNYDQHITDHAQEHLMSEAFTRLSQTCAACHQLFRDN